MQFASFTFLFFFLPITMGIYYLTPRRWKQEVMLGISILFLFCGGWMAALTELVLAALTYGAGLLLEKLRTKKALSRLTLAGTLLVQFGALIVLRSDWLYSLKAGAFHGSALFPLGLAFFVLQNAGYCIDVFHGKCRGETNWRRLGLYLLFYPRLIMGPVVSYPMVHKTICDPAFDMSRIGGGLLRFLVGMAKKLFLADWVGMLFQTLCQTSDAPYSMLVVWLGHSPSLSRCIWNCPAMRIWQSASGRATACACPKAMESLCSIRPLPLLQTNGTAPLYSGSPTM